VRLQSPLAARLVDALSLAADAEAFFLGSYHSAGFTDRLVIARDPERDLAR
jgi:hypothetical protein